MDIDALRTFLEVNRCRHFSQAASKLFVSQSTVSARIKLLEDRVGAPLFIRKRNDIQLTPTGRKLLRYAETIVTTWSRARQEITIDEDDRVPFVVGAQPSLWDALLGDWMQYFYNRVPDVIMHAEVHAPEMLSRRIQDGTMDIAFLFDHPGSLDYECVEVARIPFVMVSSKPGLDSGQAVQDNYILVEWGNSFGVSHARYFPDMPTPHLRASLGRVALDFLLNAGGSAYMPEPMIGDLLASGRLYSVAGSPVIERTAYLIHPHASQRKNLVETACEFFAAGDSDTGRIAGKVEAQGRALRE